MIFAAVSCAAEKTISYPSASLPDGGYEIPADEVLVVDVAEGATYEYSGTISGDGSVKKTGGGKLVLSGSNTFKGGFDLNGGSVQADSGTAFGSGKVTASVTSTSPRPRIIFNAPDAVFANDFDCTGSASSGNNDNPFFLFNKTVTLNGAFRFYKETYVANANNDSIVVTFNGPVTSENNGRKGLVYKCYGNTHFKEKLTASSFYIGNAYSATGSIHLWSSENTITELMLRRGSVVCEADNVLGNAHVNMRNTDGVGSIDMNGKSQSIKYIRFGTGTETSTPRDPNENDVTDNLIASADPAVLTISDSPSGVAHVGRFAIGGMVSLVVDANDTFTQVFTNRTSLTTGDMTITKGAVRLSGTASFRNAGTVTIGSSGRLFVDSTVEESLRNVGRLVMQGTGEDDPSKCVFECADGVSCPFADRTLALELNDGANFLLGEGTVLRVKSLIVNGREVRGEFNPADYPKIRVTGDISAPYSFRIVVR